MRALRRQKKRTPRCMGTLRPKNGRQKRVPKKRSKPFKISCLGRFSMFFRRGIFRTHAEHFERHAAWERDFFKKVSATLHGSAHAELTPNSRRTHAARAGYHRPLLPQTPWATKREPFARRAFGKNNAFTMFPPGFGILDISSWQPYCF